jgi:hypothetical protein
LQEHTPAKITISKENQLGKPKKITAYSEDETSGLKRKFRPKKPRGIQVIVPNISRIVFNKFCYHSNYALHEVKGTYSLLLHYSHGKRGPPIV